MKLLKVLDEKNYTEEMELYEVTHSRALIFKNGKYAMHRAKTGEYKLPGGRLEAGETPIEAVIREVMEETGLIVIPSSIEPIGEITEIRKDVFEDNMKYICHSFYYRCDVKDETVMATPSENEIAKGLRLEWAELDDIIAENRSLDLSSTRIRDTVFLEMVKAEEI